MDAAAGRSRVSSHETKKDGPTSLKRVNRAETSDVNRVPGSGWLGVVVPYVGLARVTWALDARVR